MASVGLWIAISGGLLDRQGLVPTKTTVRLARAAADRFSTLLRLLAWVSPTLRSAGKVDHDPPYPTDTPSK